ncbi:methionine adenosyltransferase [Syntrophotalea acetylenica]|uniref:S-adenosylmethionine synthetase n=1 Tax=Syntrophotalea acetylenica TaxID=29542 RepID=A0A1L3GF22_SYNAC|nr:methionine adenosyltransferase [Syntrophotalea acetylenica]APG24554.1 S-adenosylmethionine synthetase [Syntrophotalea acetylenica]APG45139.1 S-adenosylmethionine synthetase [Syntrophotalea acetylenica]
MILVEPLQCPAVADQAFEIVERKGLGHPDSMCDAMLEEVSLQLSRYYLEEFGAVLHHNIDKGLLTAGSTEKWFGGGRILKPMELTIGDRATVLAKGKRIPVNEIATTAAKDWLRGHMRFVDPERHLDCRVVLSPGSEELTDIFARSEALRCANDSSAAVGYYPLSPTEQAVLDLERYVNGVDFKTRFPDTGEDVKVMGVRRGRQVDFTVAMPLLALQVASEGSYFERKRMLLADLQHYAARWPGFEAVRVRLNALDVPGRGLGGVYLSLLGTSAEDADSGQVGRGNRVNGLIPVGRPIGTEAVAGKNPVSHVGKIYNVLAHQAARAIYEQIPALQEVYVFLVSRIGMPVDRPQMMAARILPAPGQPFDMVSRTARTILEDALAKVGRLCGELIEGKYPVC